MSELYARLLSGKALDGVEGVLAHGRWSVEAVPLCSPTCTSLRSRSPRRTAELEPPRRRRIARSAAVANRVALAVANVLDDLPARAALIAATVRAVGAHGQTVRRQLAFHVANSGRSGGRDLAVDGR
jgi:anhydro-N-acetylmuramic acid kinase